MFAAKVWCYLLASKPVPVAVSTAGSEPEVGERYQEGKAVNVDVVVTPSTVNVSAVFGEAVTEMEQVREP